MIKTPPNISVIPTKEEITKPPFIQVERTSCNISFPDGSVKSTVVDSIKRTRPDAVVIMAYLNESVYLRSCLRPAAALRHFSDPDFKYIGNLWEFPAGLIDEGETPVEAAKRECMEEIGFDVDLSKFQLVKTVLSNPAILSEQLFFFIVDLSGVERQEPTLDGSVLEEGGEVICAQISEAIQSDKIVDMKTILGLHVLQRLGFSKFKHIL